MKAELLRMSHQEQSRLEVMRLYIDGQIKQKEAARRMGLSTRQVRRLARGYRKRGCHALIHGSRGKVSNRKIRDELKQHILSLVRKHYPNSVRALQRRNWLKTTTLPSHLKPCADG